MKRPSKDALKAMYLKYYKANKAYKKQLLDRWGFTSQEEYFKYIGHTPKRLPNKVEKPVEVKKEEPKKKAKKETTKDVVLDYVIAFDTTGSMRSYIDNVKTYVKELIPKLLSSSKNLKIKVVAFGDYIDMTNYPDDFGIAYQTIELTNNEKDLINFINNAKNTSGGDGPEFYALVMNKINNETQWRNDSNRKVLFIADHDNHRIGKTGDGFQNRCNWRTEAESAVELNIQYDTLSIEGREWYKELSKITNGVYAKFKNSTQTNHIVEASVYSVTSSFMYNAKVKDVEKLGDASLLGAVKEFGKKF